LTRYVNDDDDVQRTNPFEQQHKLLRLQRPLDRLGDHIARFEELLELGETKIERPQLLEQMEPVDLAETSLVRTRH
jgi:hypothetical protein